MWRQAQNPIEEDRLKDAPSWIYLIAYLLLAFAAWLRLRS